MRSVPWSSEQSQRLARAIRARREELALSQEAAAHGAGLNVKHLQRLETESGANSANPTLSTLFRIAAVLEIPPSALVAQIE